MKLNPMILMIVTFLIVIFTTLNIQSDFTLRYGAALVILVLSYLTLSQGVTKYLLPEFFFLVMYPSSRSLLFFGGLALCRCSQNNWHSLSATQSKGALTLAVGAMKWPIFNNDSAFRVALGLQVGMGFLQKFMSTPLDMLNLLPVFLFLYGIISEVFSSHSKGIV